MRTLSKSISVLALLLVAAVSFAAGGAEAEASDEPLQIVVSTTIAGDVVANVVGDLAELTVLIGPGQSPHGYEPPPSALRAVEEADAVFLNGLNLEEGLVPVVETTAVGKVVELSQNITPIEGGHDHHDDDHDHDHGDDHDHEEGEDHDHDDDHDHDHEEGEDHDHDDDHDHDHEEGEDHDHDHDHSEGDPHVWMDPANIISWVGVVVESLSELDPANAAAYQANGDAYIASLEALDADIRSAVTAIPAGQRKLVTDHDSFGYFAAAYGFEVVGTIIPSMTDRAEPSPQDVAELVETIEREGVAAIFVGETASRGLEQLAEAVAAEAGQDVQILPTFTGALAPAGEAGDTYLDMMRFNLEQFVTGLGA